MDIPAILISQYQASLEMLRQTITQCPESIWNAASDKNKFWHTAYHMQHTGELMERLGSRTGVEIDWVGWKHG
jgi:hypothetical protein